MKRVLGYCLYGVLASVLAVQTAAAQAASTGTSSESAPQAAPDEITIGEVVVTAQRYSESLQKTSLAINVLSAEQLQSVKDVRGLQAITPGVAITNTGGVNETYIRGVGSQTAQVTAENSVAYNQDGVILYTSTMVTPLMFDLDRVEVLLGPQGTLYGRNASGGAINLISRDASLNGMNGYIEGEAGNYRLGRLTGAINLPINDTLAVRLAAEHVGHAGYLSDGDDDQNQNAGRMRVLWQPNSTVTLRVGLDGAVNHSTGAGSSIEPNPTNERWVSLTDPRVQQAFPGAVYPPGDAAINRPYYKDHQWSIFSQLDVDLGPATLTVLPAYRDENLEYHDYAPGFSEYQAGHTKQKSVEARLSHQDDHVKWVAGAYYLKIDQDASFTINQTPVTHFNVVNPQTLRSYAFFGQATYSVTPSTRLIAGLRYTDNARTSTGLRTDLVDPAGSYVIDSEESDHAITWKFGAEQDLSRDSMLFFTASRGFKGGGTYLDNPAVNSDTEFKPEFVTAYEFGSRNQFFNRKLQLNAEVFYWKLKDQQITYLGFDPVGVLSLITTNAGAAHLEGASVDAIWRPTRDDTIRAAVQYEHSNYDSFVRTIVYGLSAPLTTTCQVSGIPIPGVNPTGALLPFTPALDDCSGKPLLRAPSWTGSASYQHRFDLHDRGEVLFNIDTTFSTAAYMDPVYTELFKRPAYALLNMSLTYNLPSQGISVTAWVRNLADQRIINGGSQSTPNFLAPTDNFFQATLMPPRTMGVTARYAFR